MSFEKFFDLPMDELQLFHEICDEIKTNFFTYFGQHIVLHLEAKDDKVSSVKRIAEFRDRNTCREYYYNSYTADPCFLLKTETDSIFVLLRGEYYFTENEITPTQIISTFPLGESTISVQRDLLTKMTIQEVRTAFGEISGALVASNKNRIS